MVECLVTGEEIQGVWQCENCKIGELYACPVKQEIAEMEAYYQAQEAKA